MRTWERTFLRISDAFGRCRSVMVEKSGTTSPLGTLPHLPHAKKHEDATVHVLIYLTVAFSKNRSPGIPDLVISVQEGEEVAVKYLAMEINGTGSGGAAPVSCHGWHPLANFNFCARHRGVARRSWTCQARQGRHARTVSGNIRKHEET